MLAPRLRELTGGVGRRLEVVGVKDAKLMIFRTSHTKYQGDLKSGTLVIRDTDRVHSTVELYLPGLFDNRVLLIALDDFLSINVKNRAVVGSQRNSASSQVTFAL
jgi:hypothetical protein